MGLFQCLITNPLEVCVYNAGCLLFVQTRKFTFLCYFQTALHKKQKENNVSCWLHLARTCAIYDLISEMSELNVAEDWF